MEQGLATRRGVLRQFYICRTLRIFPLYYGELLAAWVFGSAEVRVQLPWLASYSYNFWIAQLGWYPDHLSHFWSLAVEEQFYLLWPAAILLVPRRALLPFLVAVIAAAPLYRALA